MDTIGLELKVRLQEGTIEHYWFENEKVGLARTLFHRIRIPFEPFDSGLDYVPQPERTELVVEWRYQIERLTLAREGSRYRVAGVGTVEFAREGVANDERFAFEAMAVYRCAA